MFGLNIIFVKHTNRNILSPQENLVEEGKYLMLMNKKEKDFWNLLIHNGLNRTEAEVKLKISKKIADGYFDEAYKWANSLNKRGTL